MSRTGLALVAAAAVCFTSPPGFAESTKPKQGIWYPKRERNAAEQTALREQLESVGYLGGVRTDRGGVDVTIHDPTRAFAGLNFYTSGHGPEAYLIDMDGNVVHRWHFTYEQAFPDHVGAKPDRGHQHWRKAKLLDDGCVLAIFEGIGIIKVDRDSNLVWAVNNRAHHDIELLDDGSFWTLAREAIILDDVNHGAMILEDFLLRLDPSGRELNRVSIRRALDKSGHQDLWRHSVHPRGDLFHTNSVRRLTGAHRNGFPPDRAGNLLISIRQLDVVAVVDPRSERVVWLQQGPFDAQHDAHLLDNGNLLLLDNYHALDRSQAPVQSAVIEFDPEMNPVWRYPPDDTVPFFTRDCGSADRLPNGNTLIVESNAGRALEVTDAGEIVWEFYNPHQAGEQNEFIANLFDVTRLPVSTANWRSGSRSER